MIFISGGTGLVGSHLILKLIQENHQVRAIMRSKNSLEKVKRVFAYYVNDVDNLFKKIEWVEGDISDIEFLEESMNGVEQVYHAAAIVSFHRSQRAQLKKVNVEGTANMVDTALRCGVKKFGFISSIATLGRMDAEGAVREDMHWKPSRKNSKYAVSKHQAEMEVWRAHSEGLNVVVVNPSIILGPGFWDKGSSELFSIVAKGLRFYTSGATGFVDVRDVAEATIRLMQDEKDNDRYILSAENQSYQTLFNWMADGLGVNRPSIRVRPWMGEVAWIYYGIKGMISGKTPAITRETARNSQNSFHFSNEKILKKGFQFRPLKQSIKEISAFYREDFAE